MELSILVRKSTRGGILMKNNFVLIGSLICALLMAACGSNEETKVYKTFEPNDYSLSLYNSAGNLVDMTPNTKSIYVYFTGIG